MDDQAESMVANGDNLNAISDGLESDFSESHSTTSHTAVQYDTKPILSALPIDIVSDIFIMACEDVRNLETDLFHPLPPVQFLIGSVCKAWRELAWSTPVHSSTLAPSQDFSFAKSLSHSEATASRLD
ncbi:hypothetical protein JR316_0013020 [Psilocybe cubensis]|uniref:F-box domain-containing protein n=2 Tax=Psilocybe cubensis TaxID=181762 RepID=A0A8H7XRT3_PSICU|nr:hypothetical protein JR316_0013020 [Psilocybe cubensis]KAH9474558.1 hypothetical protein JR316_0013020 [Psilocybe cubensis]